MRRLASNIIAVTVGALLAVSLFMPGSAQPAEENEASITFEDQMSDGTWVEIASANLPQGGFVVVRNESSGLLPGDLMDDDDHVLGHSDYLEPGNHSAIIVWMDQPQEGERTLTAYLYHGDENETFHQDMNQRYQRDGEDVTASATVQFEEEVGDPPNDSPTPTPEGTPAPGLVAVLAIVGLTLIAARRREQV